jgi:hypothetical protein
MICISTSHAFPSLDTINMRTFTYLAICVLWLAIVISPTQAQYQPPPTYSDYYRDQYKTTRLPPRSTYNYTIDKYYAHNENLSPYLNLTRRASPYTPKYQTFVQPEVQRREREQQAARQRPTYQSIPNLGGPAPRSQYHDHWYGGFLGGP